MSTTKLQSDIGDLATNERLQRALVRELAKPGELVDLVKYARKQFSRTLLEADDPEHLRMKIDEVLEGPSFGHIAALMLSDPEGHEIPSERLLRASLTSALGPKVAELVTEALRYMEAAEMAVEQLAGKLRAGRVVLMPSRRASDAPLGYLSDPAIHPEVGKLLLASDRSKVALFGALAVAHGRGPSWMIQELAHLWRDGSRAQLVLLASIPGVRVSHLLVSKAERLDFAALDRELAQSNAGFDAMAAEMDRRGVSSLSVEEYLADR